MKPYLLAEQFIKKSESDGLITLFHSGDASQEEDLSNGIEGTFGDWLKEVLAGAVDDADFAAEIEENTKLAFFDIEPSWVAVKAARYIGKNLDEITLDDIREHGQLCIVGVDPDDQDFFKAGERGEYVESPTYLNGETSFEEMPFGVESGDVYSTANYNPVDITLTGDDLVVFLKRNYPHMSYLQEKPLNKELETTFEKAAKGMLYGYKVMALEDGQLRSGANSALVHDLSVGNIVSMPDGGVYLSNNADYVIDYYSGLAEEEVILKLLFKPEDIVDGKEQLNDREPEIGVSKVQIVAFQDVEEYDPDGFILPKQDHELELG